RVASFNIPEEVDLSSNVSGRIRIMNTTSSTTARSASTPTSASWSSMLNRDVERFGMFNARHGCTQKINEATVFLPRVPDEHAAGIMMKKDDFSFTAGHEEVDLDAQERRQTQQESKEPSSDPRATAKMREDLQPEKNFIDASATSTSTSSR
ncbi:unnamed protein product, partial [Amoebophrya sp. A120]